MPKDSIKPASPDKPPGFPRKAADSVPEVVSKPIYSNGERYFLYGTAIFFALIMLAIGVFFRDFNDANFFIFRTVLALTAGLFGTVLIGGLFHIEGTLGKWVIKAAGGAAFFVAVYWFNPPGAVKNYFNINQGGTNSNNSAIIGKENKVEQHND